MLLYIWVTSQGHIPLMSALMGNCPILVTYTTLFLFCRDGMGEKGTGCDLHQVAGKVLLVFILL